MRKYSKRRNERPCASLCATCGVFLGRRLYFFSALYMPLLRRSVSLAACTCTTLLVLAWLRNRRSDRLRPPGCEAKGQQNGSLVADVLSDPLFARLCAAAPVHEVDARGHCFAVDGSTICLPTFLVLGFTKAGTTAFFQYVAQHPLVHASRIKEPGFLGARAEAADRDATRAGRAAKWRATAMGAGAGAAVATVASDLAPGGAGGGPSSGRGKSLQWYTRLFGSCARCERGEATPSYAWRDHAPVAALQARMLLGVKASLIMLVREPLARAASHYRYFRHKRYAGAANLSEVLSKALDELALCASQLGGWQHSCTYREGRKSVEWRAAAAASRAPQLWRHRRSDRSYELLQAGLYSEHITTWLRHFSSRRLLVLSAAELWSLPQQALRRFERFLQLPAASYTLSAKPALPRRALGGSGDEAGAGAGAAAAPGELVLQIDPPLQRRLETFLAPFNRKLAARTGITF